MTTPQLTPEQKKALEMLHSKMSQWSRHYVEKLPIDGMLQQGFFAFSNRSFENLPHGDTWTWNKSGGKAQVQLEGTIVVSLYKMNARRKSTSYTAPHLKVWIFSLAMVNRDPHLYFYWCENGEASHTGPSNAPDTRAPRMTSAVFRFPAHSYPPGSISQSNYAPGSRIFSHSLPGICEKQPELRLSDFAFLAPHTEPAVAREFGWI